MSDLINREEAIATLHTALGTRPASHSAAIEAIQAIPSAEKTGKWEYIGGYGYQYRCSVCIHCAERKTNYCPNWGAKMEAIK